MSTRFQKSKPGFTLIELIMVIVILAILFAVAIPRYISFSTQARENATRAALGGIRAAIAIQYASNAAAGTAAFPSTIDVSMFADSRIPPEQLIATASAQSTSIIYGSPPVQTSSPLGGWLYNSNSTVGTVAINVFSTHTNYSVYSAW